MKKILAIVLAACLIVAMTACSGSKDAVEAPKNIEWELKDGITLDIPEMEIDQVSINDSTESFEMIKDPFGLDIMKAEEILSEQYDFSEPYFHEFVSTTDDEIDGTWVPGYYYNVTDRIAGVSKKDVGGVAIQTKINTTISNNPSEIEIRFFGMEPGLETQAKAFDAINSLLGESWANYLVYSKDGNGVDRFDEALAFEYVLEDFVQIGDIKLLCRRAIDEDVVFSIVVEREGFNYCTINPGDYISRYDTFKYRLEDVFPSLAEDYKNCDNVYAEFFALNNANNLQNSRIDKTSHQFADYANTTDYYTEIEAFMYDGNYIIEEGDNFSVTVLVSENKSGEIVDLLVRAYGYEQLPGYEEMSKEEIMAALKPVYTKKLTYLFNNIPLFDEQWKVGEMQTFEGEYKLDCFEEELDYMLDVKMNPDGDFSWNVQLTLKDE